MEDLRYQPGPGLGALFGGETQASHMMNDAMSRLAQNTNIQSTLQRMSQEKELQPLKLEHQRLQNEGMSLGNQQKQGEITAAEEKRRREQTDAFMSYASSTDDIDGAVAYSGVKWGKDKIEALKALPASMRQRFYEQWATQNPKAREKRAEEGAKHNLEMAKQAEMNKREDLKTSTARAVAQMRANTMAAKLPNLQQYMTQLEIQANAALDSGNQAGFIELKNRSQAIMNELLRLHTAAPEARTKGEIRILRGLGVPVNEEAVGTTQQVPQQSKYNEKQADWIRRAKQANPDMSEEDIIAQGKKLGKL